MSAESSTTLTPLSTPPVDTPPPTTPVSKVRWGIHLAIMAALPVVAGLVGASHAGRGPALSDNVRGLLSVCGVEILIFTAIYGLAWLFSRATRDELLLRWRPGYWVVPLGAFYSVAIRIIAGVLGLIAVIIAMVWTKATPAEVQKFFRCASPANRDARGSPGPFERSRLFLADGHSRKLGDRRASRGIVALVISRRLARALAAGLRFRTAEALPGRVSPRSFLAQGICRKA